MAKFDRFLRLAARYRNRADFLTVYIEEAHPSDGWAFKNNVQVRRHTELTDRIRAAALLKRRVIGTGVKLVVDSMTDDANVAYGALFERVYAIENERIRFAGERGPRGYSLQLLEDWMEERFPETGDETETATVFKERMSTAVLA